MLFSIVCSEPALELLAIIGPRGPLDVCEITLRGTRIRIWQLARPLVLAPGERSTVVVTARGRAVNVDLELIMGTDVAAISSQLAPGALVQ